MLVISDKSQCCGCTACYSICPQKCIKMEADEEGFVYPKANKATCTQCGLCKKVCPIQNSSNVPNNSVAAYVVQCDNSEHIIFFIIFTSTYNA